MSGSERTWGPLELVMHAERHRGNPVRAYLHDWQGLHGHPLDRVTGYHLYDGEQDRGWWARRRLATWWRDWERIHSRRGRLGGGP